MSYLNTKKKYNIAFIAQSRFAANLLQDLAPAFGIQFEIHLVAMEQALIAARELLEDSNVDLIISCGSTAKLLQRYLGSRVLDLRHRSIDLIRALQHASQVSRSICLPYYDEIPEGIDNFTGYRYFIKDNRYYIFVNNIDEDGNGHIEMVEITNTPIYTELILEEGEKIQVSTAFSLISIIANTNGVNSTYYLDVSNVIAVGSSDDLEDSSYLGLATYTTSFNLDLNGITQN